MLGRCQASQDPIPRLKTLTQYVINRELEVSGEYMMTELQFVSKNGRLYQWA